MQPDIFEVEIQDVYNYRLSYGGQSPYFRGLEQGKLIASRCTGCGFVWLPLRPTCSKCYSATEAVETSGEGEILTSLTLPQTPAALSDIAAPVASALIKLDDADTCIKAMVVSESGEFGKGSRVKAVYRDKIRTIADFYFVVQ